MIEHISDILSSVGLLLVYLTALWSFSAPKIHEVYREINEWRNTEPLDEDRIHELQNKWYDVKMPIPLLTCLINIIFSIILIKLIFFNIKFSLSVSNSLLYLLFTAQVTFLLTTIFPFIKFLLLRRDQYLFPKEKE
ncbi:MAG: hypothetical protein ACE5KE_03875 [Methanosarcinales archaeon]